MNDVICIWSRLLKRMFIISVSGGKYEEKNKRKQWRKAAELKAMKPTKIPSTYRQSGVWVAAMWHWKCSTLRNRTPFTRSKCLSISCDFCASRHQFSVGRIREANYCQERYGAALWSLWAQRSTSAYSFGWCTLCITSAKVNRRSFAGRSSMVYL